MPELKRRRARLFGLIALAVLLLSAGGLYVSGVFSRGADPDQSGAADSSQVAVTDSTGKENGEDEPEEIPVPVEVAKVERRPIASFYRAASVVEADRLVDLVTNVHGRVQTLNVEEGDWVGEGEVLAELENGRERIQLRQAELRLTEQQRLLERNESMLAEELISHQTYDDVKSAFKLAETERDLAKIALEETILRAPFAGQVTDRQIVLGQHVAAGAPLFTLADFVPLRVRVYLPEGIARKVAENQRVLIHPEAAEAPLEATVERISPVVDPATSTVRLTLLIQEGQQTAQVGSFVKVRITTDLHTEALAIPKLALVEEGGLRSVYMAAADTVRKTEVRTGLYDETHVEILEGVEEEVFVVTLGQGGLRTGSRINVLNADSSGWADLASDVTDTDTSSTQIAKSP